MKNIEGSKNNTMAVADNKNGNSQNEMIYYDADEKQPLMGNNAAGFEN